VRDANPNFGVAIKYKILMYAVHGDFRTGFAQLTQRRRASLFDSAAECFLMTHGAFYAPAPPQPQLELLSSQATPAKLMGAAPEYV
jgi:hypothetical protein